MNRILAYELRDNENGVLCKSTLYWNFCYILPFLGWIGDHTFLLLLAKFECRINLNGNDSLGLSMFVGHPIGENVKWTQEINNSAQLQYILIPFTLSFRQKPFGGGASYVEELRYYYTYTWIAQSLNKSIICLRETRRGKGRFCDFELSTVTNINSFQRPVPYGTGILGSLVSKKLCQIVELTNPFWWFVGGNWSYGCHNIQPFKDGAEDNVLAIELGAGARSSGD